MSFQVRRLADDDRSQRSWARRALAALAIARPVIQLVSSLKKHAREQENAERRRHWLAAAGVILLAVACAAMLWFGVARAWGMLQHLNISSVLSIAAEPLPVDANGHTNVLLLGQGDTAGQDLTDTLIIASIDEADGNVVMLSLPRDLYMLRLESLGHGAKINSVYRDLKARGKRQGLEEKEASLKAMQGLATEIGGALEMDIHGVIKIGFEGFVEAVDAMGGVTVDVPEDIVDTQYPTEDYGYQTFSIKAGTQTLDGATALKYARSRHTTSDFDRSARQQQILAALAHAVREQGLLKKASTLVALQEIAARNVEMTLSVGQVLGLAKAGAAMDRENMFTMQLSDRNGLYGDIVQPGGFLYTPPRDEFDGAAVLLPVSIPEFPVTWKQLITLQRLMITIRTPYIFRPTFSVLNAGAREGTARKLATELTRYGFDVRHVGNAPSGDQPDGFLATDPATEKGRYLAGFFSGFLALPRGSLPTDLPPQATADVIIVLGKNNTFTPFQSLTFPE
jgi:LCP family protein required for cell wall assembly